MGYVRGRFGGGGQESAMCLADVCVGPGLLQQVQAAVEEALVTHSFVDVAVIG